MAHEVTGVGYPVDPELRRLEFLLGDLAAHWRGSYHDPERQQAIVRTYHETLYRLYELGWDAALDMASQLPDNLMLVVYTRRHPPQGWEAKNLYSKPYQLPTPDAGSERS